MKTPEFEAAVAQEEKIIHDARRRLSELNCRAIEEICPVSIGDILLATHGVHAGREMVVESVFVIPPLLNDGWVFKVIGSSKKYPKSHMAATAFIPFPEE